MDSKEEAKKKGTQEKSDEEQAVAFWPCSVCMEIPEDFTLYKHCDVWLCGDCSDEADLIEESREKRMRF